MPHQRPVRLQGQNPRRFLGAFAAALLLGAPAQAQTVAVKDDALLVDGKPWRVQAVSGRTQLEVAKAMGANSVRTYGDETARMLDEAHRHGLKVIAGFWLGHPRLGFDYGDRAQVERQLAELRAFVLAHKDHPALLMWGIGNEVEAELADHRAVWPAIEEAARLVKGLDPAHPTLAVLAETGPDKVALLKKQAPSIDILGINSYGDSLRDVVDRARSQGWDGPVLITEMGALGQWQAAKTPWGAAIEPSSTEKAARLREMLPALDRDSIGQVAFYWGQKQEVTPTWHSLLLPDGTWTETAEVLAAHWGGTTPGGNRAPRIRHLAFTHDNQWSAASWGHALLEVEDPDGDRPRVEWRVMGESTDLRKGGDAEAVPQEFPQALFRPTGSFTRIAGLKPGAYRLFVTVSDGRGGAATANLPFLVR